jgi:predicted Zn-dependent protease
MYTRDEVKAITDKIFNMGKGADAVEVDLTGSERSGTRWANSTITTNLVQFDRQLTITVRIGQKTGNVSTRDFSDAALQASVNEAIEDAKGRPDSPSLPELLGAQTRAGGRRAPSVNFGRARDVWSGSIDLRKRRRARIETSRAGRPAGQRRACSPTTHAPGRVHPPCRMADGSGSAGPGSRASRTSR